jgi:hypothetical protein
MRKPGDQWRKSSHSTLHDNCVEVRQTDVGVAVRDSQDPGGVVLHFDLPAWQAFVSAIKDGEFG